MSPSSALPTPVQPNWPVHPLRYIHTCTRSDVSKKNMLNSSLLWFLGLLLTPPRQSWRPRSQSERGVSMWNNAGFLLADSLGNSRPSLELLARSARSMWTKKWRRGDPWHCLPTREKGLEPALFIWPAESPDPEPGPITARRFYNRVTISRWPKRQI